MTECKLPFSDNDTLVGAMKRLQAGPGATIRHSTYLGPVRLSPGRTTVNQHIMDQAGPYKVTQRQRSKLGRNQTDVFAYLKK